MSYLQLALENPHKDANSSDILVIRVELRSINCLAIRDSGLLGSRFLLLVVLPCVKLAYPYLLHTPACSKAEERKWSTCNVFKKKKGQIIGV